MNESPTNRTRTLRAGWIVAFVLLMGTFAAVFMRSKQPPRLLDSAKLVTQVYAIKDVLPAFEAAEQTMMGSTDPGFRPPPVRPRTPDEMAAALISQIEETIDPGSWITRGGNTGAIQIDNGQLVITQTRENHDKVAKFISGKSIQLTVETKVLTGDAIFAALEQLNEGQSLKWEPVGDAETWPVFLSEQDVSRILRASQTDQTTTIMTAPRLTLFNGQRAWVVVESETAYVADLKPLPDLSFEPVVGTIGAGVRLNCRAEVKADSQLVNVTLNPRMTALLALRPEPRSNVQNGQINQAFVQIPTVRVMEFNQTFAMPNGTWALFRAYGQVIPAPPEQEPEKPVLIMIRPTIVNQPGV